MILTIHFLHCSDVVLGIFEANEAISFAFVGSFVPDNFGSYKRGIMAEVAMQ